MALSTQERQKLQDIARELRLTVIDVMAWSGGAHVGGSLSIIDILTILYFKYLDVNPADPQWDERDRFVLSKGHGGPALYATLALRGYFPLEKLQTLNRPGTDLPSHCDMNRTPGIDMTTGSLGQGFSCAVGMALGARMEHLPSTIFACIGDGESQEGQVWEAAMLAASQRLGNLIAFTDYNKMQIDGYIEDINGLYPLADKWESFGWHVQSVDGHDVSQIAHAIDCARLITGRPSMILLNTIKGKGCCFCENKLSSHSVKNITEEMWQKAVALLDGRDA